MSKSPRLTDLQRILLAHAAKHDGGSLHPLPDAALRDPERTDTDLKSLLRRELLGEVPVGDAGSTWRTEGEQSLGLIVTAKGLSAIGINADGEAGAPSPAASLDDQVAACPRPSKQADVVMLMRRGDGATIEEMMGATGWLAHSTRAVLTGLRKKGHAIDRGKRGDLTCYRIVEVG